MGLKATINPSYICLGDEALLDIGPNFAPSSRPFQVKVNTHIVGHANGLVESAYILYIGMHICALACSLISMLAQIMYVARVVQF